MNEESSVEKLKRKLYARGEKPKLKPRRVLHEIEHEEVVGDWDHEAVVSGSSDISEPVDPHQVLDDLYHGHVHGSQTQVDEFAASSAVITKNERSITSRIIRLVFVVSFIFFIFAAGFAGYFLIVGKNSVSCDNVAIGISGPLSVASGKKLALDIRVSNNNPVPMRNATLEVVFPEGSRDADNSSANLTSTKEQIGTVEVGESVRTTARAVLFGQEQTMHEIEVVATFGIDDSSATFTCKKPYSVNIATSPVSMTVDGLEEISSGQEVELTVHVTSNSEEVVPNQRLVVEYPFGFKFVSSQPVPTTDDNVWDFGDITPGVEKTLTIKGTVQGQGIESRTIRFSFGGGDDVDARSLATVLQKIEHPLFVTRPFLSLDLELDGNSKPEITSQLGKKIKGTLKWENTLPSVLHDVEIDLVFKGDMLNKSSISGQSFFFRSVDNTLTWTPQTTGEEFRVIDAGEKGELVFFFDTKKYQEGASIENPFMNIECEVRARRVSDNIPVPQSLTGQVKRTIRFDSDLLLDTYGLYGVGPFTNTGPFPPRVDQQTTYTIVWEVTNTTNNVSSAIVKGTLPVNVNWLNAVSPQGESVVFNPVTREVIWSLGNVQRGTGGGENEPRKIYFQVAATPSITHLGKYVTIIEKMEVQGVDGFTSNMLQGEARDVETVYFKKDPLIGNIRGIVEN